MTKTVKDYLESGETFYKLPWLTRMVKTRPIGIELTAMMINAGLMFIGVCISMHFQALSNAKLNAGIVNGMAFGIVLIIVSMFSLLYCNFYLESREKYSPVPQAIEFAKQYTWNRILDKDKTQNLFDNLEFCYLMGLNEQVTNIFNNSSIDKLRKQVEQTNPVDQYEEFSALRGNLRDEYLKISDRIENTLVKPEMQKLEEASA